MNGAHLVGKKDIWKKQKIIHSRSLNALSMQFFFWIVSSSKPTNFVINEK
jgi:hypothetical protein